MSKIKYGVLSFSDGGDIQPKLNTNVYGGTGASIPDFFDYLIILMEN